jgi:hypothetical protein
MKSTNIPRFTAEAGLRTPLCHYYGVHSESVSPRIVSGAQAGSLRRLRGDTRFDPPFATGGGPAAVFLTVHECLRLGGKVELKVWCDTGLMCRSESGTYVSCIDEGVASR